MVSVVATAAATHGIGDALLGGTAKASAAFAGEGPNIAHAVVARARHVKASKRWPRSLGQGAKGKCPTLRGRQSSSTSRQYLAREAVAANFVRPVVVLPLPDEGGVCVWPSAQPRPTGLVAQPCRDLVRRLKRVCCTR